VGDRQPEYVLELNLDTKICPKIVGLDHFVNLETLSLNSCGLQSLDGFATLPKLTRVTPPQTSFHNMLSASPPCRSLWQLELADNRFEFAALEGLQKAGISTLQHLTLAGNSKLDSLEHVDFVVSV